MESVFVPLGGHAGASLAIGDGLEEAVSDGPQHGVVEVDVGFESGAYGPW
jgi:hypothetical protein